MARQYAIQNSFMAKFSPNSPCPCDSGKKYKKCCRPFHHGRRPETPEQLMRSRYTAYALGNVSYVMETTHADSPHRRPDHERWLRELERFVGSTVFTGLIVMSTSVDGEQGWVTFKANLQQGGKDASFIERSLFEQVDGQWLYKAAVVQS